MSVSDTRPVRQRKSVPIRWEAIAVRFAVIPVTEAPTLELPVKMSMSAPLPMPTVHRIRCARIVQEASPVSVHRDMLGQTLEELVKILMNAQRRMFVSRIRLATIHRDRINVSARLASAKNLESLSRKRQVQVRNDASTLMNVKVDQIDVSIFATITPDPSSVPVNQVSN